MIVDTETILNAYEVTIEMADATGGLSEITYMVATETAGGACHLALETMEEQYPSVSDFQVVSLILQFQLDGCEFHMITEEDDEEE